MMYMLCGFKKYTKLSLSRNKMNKSALYKALFMRLYAVLLPN